MDNEIVKMRCGADRWGFWITGPDADATLAEIMAWCENQFGACGPVWYTKRRDVWFKQEDAAFEFKLRWL